MIAGLAVALVALASLLVAGAIVLAVELLVRRSDRRIPQPVLDTPAPTVNLESTVEPLPPIEGCSATVGPWEGACRCTLPHGHRGIEPDLHLCWHDDVPVFWRNWQYAEGSFTAEYVRTHAKVLAL